jgi:hypothetical protein
LDLDDLLVTDVAVKQRPTRDLGRAGAATTGRTVSLQALQGRRPYQRGSAPLHQLAAGL